MKSESSFWAFLLPGLLAGLLILTTSSSVVSVPLKENSEASNGAAGQKESVPQVPADDGSRLQGLARTLDLLVAEHHTIAAQIVVVQNQYQATLKEIIAARGEVASLREMAREILEGRIALVPASSLLPSSDQGDASKVDGVSSRSGSVSKEDLSPLSSQLGVSGHWLTLSSGKRHNSRCRYYGRSEGRGCLPDEGTPCRLCGG